MMLQDSSVDLLARVPLFAGVHTEALEAFIFMNPRRNFRPLETILKEGQSTAGAFLILYGTAEQVDENGRGSGMRFGPGSLLDEMSMFIETESDRTVVAAGFVQTVEITRSVVRDVLAFDGRLAQFFAERIESRMSRLVRQLQEFDDTLVRSLAVMGGGDRIPQERERDRTDAANPGSPESPASTVPIRPAPASPTHGPVAAHG